jgi:hypothetical protein
MIRYHWVLAAAGLLWLALYGCDSVLGLAATDPTLLGEGGRAGAAGQADVAGSAGSSLGESGTGG